MLIYDEASQVRELTKLSSRLRAVFALACALRMVPAYGRFQSKTGIGDSAALKSLADALTEDLASEPNRREVVDEMLRRCMNLIPSEDASWDEETQPYAEDAAAALAYAFRTRLNQSAQEAAFAGRRAYEAVEHYAAALSADRPTGSPSSRAVVQLELVRQRRDLQDLLAVEEECSAEEHRQAVLAVLRRAQSEAPTFLRSVS